jgi:hypothetical protein
MAIYVTIKSYYYDYKPIVTLMALKYVLAMGDHGSKAWLTMVKHGSK